MVDNIRSRMGASFSALIHGIIADARELGMDYVALIRDELLKQTRKAAQAALWLAIGAGILIVGSIMVLLMLPALLNWAVPQVPIWGWVGIIGVVLAGAGGGLIALGIGRAPGTKTSGTKTETKIDPEMQVVADRHEVETTKAALMAKVETLEEKIAVPVEGASVAVNNAIDEVKVVVGVVKDEVRDAVGAVKDEMKVAMEAVKETLDVPLQVNRHPWGMMLGSVAFGFLAGKRLEVGSSSATNGHHHNGSGDRHGTRTNGHYSSEAFSEPRPAFEEASGSPASGPLGYFDAELSKLKRLGIGMVLGVVRDTLTTSVPDGMKSKLGEVVDSITVKLGGEPVKQTTIRTSDRQGVTAAG